MSTAVALSIGIVAWLAISFLVARGFGRFMRHCDRVDAEEEWTPRGWQVHPVTTKVHEPDEIVITTTKLPCMMVLAMDVAPLVRQGLITDDEGHMLVQLRYAEELERLDSRRQRV